MISITICDGENLNVKMDANILIIPINNILFIESFRKLIVLHTINWSIESYEFKVSIGGKLVNERHTIAIKLANGATRKAIVIDCIFEVLIFSTAAMALDLILLYLFQAALVDIVAVLFSWRLVLFCLATAVAFSLIVGTVSGLVATRFNVAKLLQV